MNSKLPSAIKKILEKKFPIIEESMEHLIAETIEITETPAPPFKEEKRAKLIQKKFEEIGYMIKTDKIGNVLACKDFSHCHSPLVVSAHLDTVFPDSLSIKVVREGTKLLAPGVGDDSRGLVNLLMVAKLVYDVDTEVPILFVATVGEEGLGDLRGVKHFFQDDEHKIFGPIKAFITIDGNDSKRIVNIGIGSYRYRIHIKGPGGHSFGAFGTVNPAYTLGHIIHQFSKIKVPNIPKTTFSVGVLNGGTSINAIPYHVYAEVDLRSESRDELNKLDEQLRNIIQDATLLENSQRDGDVSYEIEEVGNRPVGITQLESDLITAISQANRFLKIGTNFVASSTDANVPMSLNIPAISIAGVEYAGRAHSTDEWIDAGESSLISIKRNLLLVLLLSI